MQARDEPSENKIQCKSKAQGKSSEPSAIWKAVYWHEIQCLHCPNITRCGKYPCARVKTEGYFAFTRCSANTRISATCSRRKREKKKQSSLCLCLCLHQGHFYSEISITEFTLVLVSLVRTRLKQKQKWYF